MARDAAGTIPAGRAGDMPAEAGGRRLAQGDRVLLVDARDRRYLLTLRAGDSFHTHAGLLGHDAVIGVPEGSYVHTTSGKRFLAMRPTLSDLVVKMPRGAQVIYPKDLGAILMVADISPGDRVLEAGVGSGALSMALLRTGAKVVGYEVRPDFASVARANVTALLGRSAPYEIRMGDIYEGVPRAGFDQVVLDVPEPWRVVPHLPGALRPGGILVSYLPTINQTAELREVLRRSSFAAVETFEVIHRTWHIEGRSVRPDHRMVGHTGFVTHGRMLNDPDSDRAGEVSPAR